MAIRISEGAVYCEELNRQDTVYRIQNSHPETFPLEIEHPRTWPDSEAGGLRLVRRPRGGGHPRRAADSCDPPGQGAPGRQREGGAGRGAAFLADRLVAPRQRDRVEEPRHRRTRGFSECIDLQGEIDGIQAEISEKEETATTIAEEQERLMKLIPNGHGEQANAWRTDLANAEKELREVKRSVIPKLRGQLKEAQDGLHEALSSLRYEWSEGRQREGR